MQCMVMLTVLLLLLSKQNAVERQLFVKVGPHSKNAQYKILGFFHFTDFTVNLSLNLRLVSEILFTAALLRFLLVTAISVGFCRNIVG